MGRAEALPDARHAREDLAREHDRFVDGLELVEAVVARAAVGLRVGLAEVSDQMAMAAADARRVAFDVAEQRATRVGELAVALEHDAPLQEVGRRVDQHALRFEAVAPGAAGLLLVVLERLRRAGVNDEAHVRSVDAHAEGHGGDDDVGVLVEKRVLIPAALVVGEAGMVGPGANAGLGQPRRQRVDLAARRAVDDAGLAACAGP